MVSSEDISIIVPTFKRHEFIRRLLNYYRFLKVKNPIYIADSTPTSFGEVVKNVVNEYINDLNITYLFVPNKNALSASYEVLKNINTKYVCWTADDDYQIPSGILKCAEFLESNLEFSCARGEMAPIFSTDSDGAFGEIKDARIYDRPISLVSENAQERVADLLSNYHVLQYSVQRTEISKKCHSVVSKVPSHLIGELQNAVLFAANGKSKVLSGCMNFARQDHGARGGYSNILESMFDPMDFESYQVLIENVAKDIQATDKSPVEMIIKKIKLSLTKYIEIQAIKQMPQVSSRFSKYIPSSLKNLIKRFITLVGLTNKQYFESHYFFGEKSQFPEDVQILKKSILNSSL